MAIVKLSIVLSTLHDRSMFRHLGLGIADFIAILLLHLTFYLQNSKSSNVVL